MSCDDGVETVSTKVLNRVKFALESAIEHAQAYRNLYFTAIEERDAAWEEIALLRKTVRQQRKIIGKLEDQLGIDQEL